jgi:hypothetical protein
MTTGTVSYFQMHFTKRRPITARKKQCVTNYSLFLTLETIPDSRNKDLAAQTSLPFNSLCERSRASYQTCLNSLRKPILAYLLAVYQKYIHIT